MALLEVSEASSSEVGLALVLGANLDGFEILERVTLVSEANFTLFERHGGFGSGPSGLGSGLGAGLRSK